MEMKITWRYLSCCSVVLLGGLALGCGGGEGNDDVFAGGAGGASGETTSGDATSNGSTSSGGDGEGQISVYSVQGYGDQLGQTASAVAHFPNGDIVVTGSFYGSVDFGSGATETSMGQQDIFVARYTPEGTNLWVRTMGNQYSSDSGQDRGYDVAVDLAGNVVVVGHTPNSYGWPKAWWPAGLAHSAAVMVKLNGETGVPIWGKLFGTTAVPLGGAARSLAIDAKGNILVAATEPHYNGSAVDLLSLYKFSPDAEQLWRRTTTGCDTSVGLAVAAHGSNTYVTGYFEDTCNFGGTPLVSAGGRDMFLAKYDENGDHVSSTAFGGPGHDAGLALAVGELSGDVAVTGSFEGTSNFGGGALKSAGLKDGFILKLSIHGAHLWSQRFGGPLDDAGLGIATDSHERVYLSGYHQAVIDMGTGPIKSNGGGDVLAAKFEPTGEALWVRSFGGNAWDEGASLSLGPDKSMAAKTLSVVGNFQATAAFGDINLSSSGSSDMFILQLGE